MKHFISRRNFLKAAGVTAAASAMAAAVPQASAGFLTGKDAAVTILYTNDVHTYIDNKSPKLTYAAIAAMKQGYVDEGKPVLLVDAGDHIQGTAYGSMDNGATIIELMNEAGYDIATLGNHEFDYGMARAKAIIKEADFPYVSCNWVDLRTGLRVLPAVKLFPAGGKWIAFVGITTPESFTKSTPAYFMNAKQTKYIYDILGGDDGRKLYDAVQKAIDKAKALAQTSSSVWAIWALTRPPLPGPVRKSLPTPPALTLHRRPLSHRHGEQAGLRCSRQGCHPDPDRLLSGKRR